MDGLLLRRSLMMQSTTDYTLVPLTFKCITGGVLSIKNENSSYDRNFNYSLNGGAWTNFPLPANSGVLLITTLSPGDTISFRRDSDNFYQAQFVSDSNLTFDIYGNILSLQYGSAFNGQTELRNTSKQAFGYTFKDTNVVDASNLMLTAPTLSTGCYQEMFTGCASLTATPALPATILADSCYRNMFANCTSLTSAPALASTSIVANCYRSMFSGCTSLTEAPDLPATTLADYCYRYMFGGCANLTEAPELPATSIATGAYYQMFQDCSSLSSIKCLATSGMATSTATNDTAATRNTYKWVNRIASNGTFTKATGATWVAGVNGVPSGWTIVDATN